MVSKATPTIINRLVLLKVKDLIPVNPVIKNGAIAIPPKNNAPAQVILTITLFFIGQTQQKKLRNLEKR